MNRFLAIVEREMRKFFRSPVLMIMSMMLPIVQLIILGHAYGGHIQGAKVAVVDHDGGPQAVKVHEAFDSVAVEHRHVQDDFVLPGRERRRKEDVRTGKVDAAVIIPAQYSRRVYAQGCSAHRAGGGQLGPDHERQHRGRDAVAGECAESAGDSSSAW